MSFTNTMQIKGQKTNNLNKSLRDIMTRKALYVMLLIPALHLLVFCYLPMYGVVIAFKDFNYSSGILGSPWNNFEHFSRLFTDPFFTRVLSNTLKISFLRIVTGFPAPIILALLLNEIVNMRFKKIVQTISYLPYFMSWIVVAGLFMSILSPQTGVVNYILVNLFKIQPINFLSDTTFFVPILLISGIWKGIGFGSVIYLAAIASIDLTLYDAASIDGATRFQRVLYITLPSIAPTITILFLLGLGDILNAGFDQIYNFYNPLVYSVADIIDTYTYRVGLLDARYDYATAVGLFKNVAAFLLVYFSNIVTRKFSDYTLW